jgi:hypothetical protein
MADRRKSHAANVRRRTPDCQTASKFIECNLAGDEQSIVKLDRKHQIICTPATHKSVVTDGGEAQAGVTPHEALLRRVQLRSTLKRRRA